MLDEIDHQVYIDGTDHPQAMQDVDPQKMMRRQAAFMPLIGWQQEKEEAGLLHWTIGLWGTEAMAAEAGLSVEEYWEQIIKACFLDDPDPIARWRETIERDPPLPRLAQLAADRAAAPRGRGHRPVADARRAPSLARAAGAQHPELRDLHEPRLARDRRARIRFSEPLYTHGTLVKGVRLEFKDGLVVGASAEQNEELLRADRRRATAATVSASSR